MANLYALARENGQMRNLTSSDALVVAGIQRTSGDSGSIAIGTDANTSAVDIGSSGVLTTVKGDFQVDGATTLVSASTLEGDVDLGNGDGDIITLGGAYVSAVDVVNIGTANASGDTDVNLRVDMDVDANKSINFDRTADSDAAVILPDTADAPTQGVATGMIRVNGAGAFQWYNGSTWQTAGTSAGNSLQQAYDQGNTITTDASGDIAFTLSASGNFTVTNGTDQVDFNYAAANQLSVDADVQNFDLDAGGTITMDGTLNIGQTTPAATLQSYTSVAIDATSTVGIDADANSYFKVDGADLDLQTSTAAADTDVVTTLAAANTGVPSAATNNSSVVISSTSTNGTGIIDIDADDAITIDSASAGVSIDAAGSSNFTTSSGNIVMSAAGALDMDAVGGGFTLDGTSTSSITMTVASARPLTIASAGGGSLANTLVLNSDGTGTDAIDINATVGGVDIDSATSLHLQANGTADLTLYQAGTGDILAQTTVGTITLQAVGAGGFVKIDSANDAVDINADTNVTIDAEGGGVSIDAVGAAGSPANSNFTATSSIADQDVSMTLSAVNSGVPSASTNIATLNVTANSSNDNAIVNITADGDGTGGDFIYFKIGATTVGTFGTDIGGSAVGFQLQTGTDINEFSTDGTLAGNSDDAVPTEQAVKTYVDAQIGGSNSLEEVYNGGAPGTPDNLVTMSAASGTVSWTVPAAANIQVMSFIQNDTTNNPDAVEIQNAGTGASLQFTGTTRQIESSGILDINFDAANTGAAFTISEAGTPLATFDDGDVIFSATAGTSDLTVGDYTYNAVAYNGFYSDIDYNHATLGGYGTFDIDNAGGGASGFVVYSRNSGGGTSAVLLRAESTGGTAQMSFRCDDTIFFRYNEDTGASATFEIRRDNTAIITGDAAGAVDITPISGQDANITTAGTGSGIVFSSAGTDAAAIDIDSAGGIDTDAAGLISFVSSLEDVAVQLSATGTAGGIDFNAGSRGFDFDAATGSFDVVSQVVSLDSTQTSNFTVTANNAAAQTLTIKCTNAGAGDGDIVIEAENDMTFDALGMTTPLPLNEAGDLDLDAAFTATSIVGCLNELKGEISDVGAWSDTADVAITANDVVTLDNGAAAGRIGLADANVSGAFVVGVAVTSATAGNPVDVQTVGKVTVATSDGGAWTIGDAIYMSGTAGEGTSTPPSGSGDTVQRIGWATGNGREVVLTIGEPTTI